VKYLKTEVFLLLYYVIKFYFDVVHTTPYALFHTYVSSEMLL